MAGEAAEDDGCNVGVLNPSIDYADSWTEKLALEMERR